MVRKAGDTPHRNWRAGHRPFPLFTRQTHRRSLGMQQSAALGWPRGDEVLRRPTPPDLQGFMQGSIYAKQ